MFARRGPLRGHLRELVRIEQAYRREPVRLARELAGLRKRMREEVGRGGLRPAHFGEIEQRLEPALAQARREAVLELAGPLPGPVSGELERLLFSGDAAAGQQRRVNAVLEKAGVPRTVQRRVRAELGIQKPR